MDNPEMENNAEVVVEDANTESDLETTEDVKEEPTKDTDTSAEVTKEHKESIIDRVLKKVGIGKDKDEDEVVESEDKLNNTLIDESFVDAALKNGWTEDQITNFASDYTDEELEEMIPSLLASDEEPDRDSEDKQVSTKPQDDPQDVGKKEDNEEIQALRDELKSLKESLGKDDEARRLEAFVDIERQANEVFDEAAKDFEIFGQTKDLPRFPNGKLISTSPQFKARSQVYDVAVAFMKSGFQPKQAMGEALKWFKGNSLEKDVHNKVVKDLKRQEKKLSAKRQTKELPKEYKNETERKEALIENLEREWEAKNS